MSNELTYTLSLQDKITAKLQKIGITSTTALDKFSKLQQSALKSAKVMRQMGGSVGALRQKLELLRAERDWIPQKNIATIRKYNTEIGKLEKKITKFETINGSRLKRNLKQAVRSMPFSEFITNPVTLAGAAFFKSGKMALSFEQGMAKINTTAQLSKEKLSVLKKNLIDMGVEAGADLNTIPDSFEKILSQTGDVSLSQQILKTALKGSKAGFTDTTVVANALSQSLSLIGKENASAQEVLDTFFAAKRVGAGEFQDFANHMPNLISSGKALGVTYKQTAGLFAYMTGKGFAAERSATLLENAYSALGKTNIQKNLDTAGIAIFDKDGTLKDMGDIFNSLQDKLSAMSDKKKSNFLAKIGLVDKEARAAFMVLASDSKKLRESLKATAQAQGETNDAYEKAKNPIMQITALWSKIQGLAIKLGGVLSLILIPAFSLLALILTPIIDLLGWLFSGIENGNPIVLILVGIVSALTVLYYAQTIALKLNTLWKKRNIISSALLAIKTKALSIATGIQTGAQWLLNTAMAANPIGLIVIAVTALIALITIIIVKYEQWGAALSLILGPVGSVIMAIQSFRKHWDSITEAFSKGGIIAGIKRIGIVLLDALLMPVQQLLELLSNIPGLGKIAGSGADIIKNLRTKLELTTPEDKGISPAKKAVEEEEKKKLKEDPLGKTNKTIATGGTKHNYITINLKDLIGVLNIKGNDFKDSARQMEEQSADALLRTLALATTAGS